MKKAIIILIVYSMLILLLQADTSEPFQELIDLHGLRIQGDDWVVVKQGTSPNGGQLKLIQDKWLMYFLHWKPLTEERKKISVAYSRKLLLSLWGPNMPFNIMGEGGETRVGSHQAFFIDGTIYDGKIRTRFIVWNCPESNRQFIADCNINKKRGTPNHLLKLQFDITSTIACHNKPAEISFPNLTQQYRSEPFNLTFDVPETWHTSEFNYPKWYPQGLSRTSGSLWTLPTESVKYIELLWKKSPEKVSIPFFRKSIEEMAADTFMFEKVQFKSNGFEIKDIMERGKYLEADICFALDSKFRDQSGKIWEDKDNYTGKAFLWEHHSNLYILLAALISRQNMWGLAVDLSPKKKVLENFIIKEVLPNIKVFKKSN